VDTVGSGQGPVAGCCECGDEPSGSGATDLVLFYCMSFRSERTCFEQRSALRPVRSG
jgi:hypothetical protein